MRYGMVIDLQKCVGCNSCTVACRAEQGTPAGIHFHKVVKYEAGKYPNAKMKFLPMPCMHCQDPPCLKVCPTGATFKNEKGLVLIDQTKCIGCRACMVACPYDQRFYLAKERYYFKNGPTPFEQIGYQRHQEGVVSKCNFCAPRLEKGLEPACAANCMTKARTFGDLEDPNSEASRLIRDRGGYQLYPELGTNPSVYYLPA